MKVKTKYQSRIRRHFRVRGKVIGSAAKPRMSVYVSNRNIFVQFVAKQLGAAAAAAAKAKGIETVVFDRGGFAFKARLKALADAAREAGLKF